MGLGRLLKVFCQETIIGTNNVQVYMRHQGPRLLTWIIFNPIMDK